MARTEIMKILSRNYYTQIALTIVVSLIIQLSFIQPALSRGVTPDEWGLKEYHIENETLGDIYFYVTLEGIDQ